MPACDALAVMPPYSESRSLTSTVSGTSTAMLWPAGDDSRGSAGRMPELASAASDRSVATADDSDELPKPIDSVLAGTVA
jgi:hypothetical protein